MIIPDSRWEMPGLLTPGRKPAGNVKIDWSLPLTNGLSVYLLFNKNAHNLATGQTFDEPLVPWDYIDSPNGILTDNTTENASTYSLPQDPSAYCYGTYPNGRSYFIVCTPSAVTAGPQGLFIEGATINGISVMYRTTPDTLNYYYTSDSGADVSNAPSSQTFSPGDEMRVACVYSKTNNNLKVYLDGKLDYTSGTLGAMGAHTARPECGGSSLGREWYGTIEVFAVWDRELTPEEAKSFNDNPYQVLIPA